MLSPVDVTSDLIEARGGYSASSWVLYRAALLWHLASHRATADVFAAAFRMLAASPNTIDKEGGELRRARDGVPTGKSTRKKSIPVAHFERLLRQLNKMNRTTNWGTSTSYWLLAGLATGARPGEWRDASWLDDSETVLCIPNSKRKMAASAFTMLRAGETIHDLEANHPERLVAGPALDDRDRIRNVPIEPSDRIHVSLHLSALNDYLDGKPGTSREKRFVSYYNMCRKILRDACRRAFNERRSYSLYVMRSQFAANMKAKLPLDEVAALMGHAKGSRVTMSHYGSRRAAHGGPKDCALKRQQVRQQETESAFEADETPPRDKPK